MASADDAEWRAAADRIGGGHDQWYSCAGSSPRDAGFKLIGTMAEAEVMQRWIAASGIETRPAPERYRRSQLGVTCAKPS